MNAHSHGSRALRALARLLSEIGLHGLAANLLHYQWRHGLRSNSQALAIGNARLHAGQNGSAVAFFGEACKREASHAEARAGLVCALFRQGSVRDAGREASRLAAAAPCAEVWILVAELRKRVGDTIGSIEAYRQAARAPLAPARFVLGEAIFGEDEWGDLLAPLANIQGSRPAVGVGTHLVRSRGSLVSRAFARRRDAAVFVVIQCLLSTGASAQDASPSPAPNGPLHQPNREVVVALPSAGSLTARVVQLNSGLVLEREEGAGLFPAEPSRFAFRGGSWTQSRIEIDGFDVTDPIFGGRPLVWGTADLGDIEVKTDSKGTVLLHNHPTQASPAQTRFIAQANLGAFDSTGTTADPIPSLARGHSLVDGFLSLSGSARGGATTWNGALSGADVSRSERDSDLERATARVGFEGRFTHASGPDRFQGLAMLQSRRAPFGFTTAETRSSGLMAGVAWSRPDQGGQPRDPENEAHARFSFRRGTAEDPVFGAARVFERLVDGTPDSQVPYRSAGAKVQLEAAHPLGWFGDATALSVQVRLSRATGERAATQPMFQALERLNGLAARQWTFSAGAPSRVAENRASVGFGFEVETSERTRLGGTLAVERVSVGDRDGERILGSTKVLPELKFEWRKSERTILVAEASLGTPPVPLASYEAALRNAPTLSARLWRDLDRDNRASGPELGRVVASRSPGSVGVDPDLSLPTMRRVMIGFRTRVGGLGISATVFARRDRDLIETALDPQGSEIFRTRSLPDPSGDIDGASDDQLLPVVEESLASFTASQFLLTNPAEHRALGEGAELGFETNGKHIHWGLSGAAFRVSGRGGNRGLRVSEGDFGVVGESFDRTNADTFGYGRLFFDRAYSLRMHLTANDVRGFTFGAIGRYDDGQPFARLVIQDDLPQGPDFVQAIPRGRQRLHYTLSVDARLARRFKIAETQVEVSASVFNALGSQFEAEEQVVWLPDYRRITMVQPPRAFLIGVRIER